MTLKSDAQLEALIDDFAQWCRLVDSDVVGKLIFNSSSLKRAPTMYERFRKNFPEFAIHIGSETFINVLHQWRDEGMQFVLRELGDPPFEPYGLIKRDFGWSYTAAPQPIGTFGNAEGDTDLDGEASERSGDPRDTSVFVTEPIPLFHLKLSRSGEIIEFDVETGRAHYGNLFQRRLSNIAKETIRRVIRGDLPDALIFAADPSVPKPTMFLVKRHDTHSVVLRPVVDRWPAEADRAFKTMFSLTEAELKIVRAIFDSRCPKDIARQRGASIDTIRTQIKSIFRKMDINKLADLIHMSYSIIRALSHNDQSHNGMLGLSPACPEDSVSEI